MGIIENTSYPRIALKIAMQGFLVAMNPSLGLVGCCDCREGRVSRTARGTNWGKLDVVQTEVHPKKGSTSNMYLCGVGIEFLQDDSGALFVSALIPQGAYKNGCFTYRICSFALNAYFP